MSLHFDVKVNGSPIARVVIQRQHELTADRISDYSVTVNNLNGIECQLGVRHNYDDGWLPLVVKALSAVETWAGGGEPA